MKSGRILVSAADWRRQGQSTSAWPGHQPVCEFIRRVSGSAWDCRLKHGSEGEACRQGQSIETVQLSKFQIELTKEQVVDLWKPNKNWASVRDQHSPVDHIVLFPVQSHVHQWRLSVRPWPMTVPSNHWVMPSLGFTWGHAPGEKWPVVQFNLEYHSIAQDTSGQLINRLCYEVLFLAHFFRDNVEMTLKKIASIVICLHR